MGDDRDPEDMRAAPGTAGRPPRGTVVKIYDENGKPGPAGETGRIFVGNEMLFEGYTGGGTQGRDRRADGDRRRRPLRLRRAPVRRGPRRRDDRLGRRERLPEGGRGPDRQPRRRSPRRPRSASRTRVRPAPARPSSSSRTARRPTEDELKATSRTNLARYKVPREIGFIDELPRNATGKVLKRELKEREEGQGGGPASAAASRDVVRAQVPGANGADLSNRAYCGTDRDSNAPASSAPARDVDRRRRRPLGSCWSSTRSRSAACRLAVRGRARERRLPAPT